MRWSVHCVELLCDLYTQCSTCQKGDQAKLCGGEEEKRKGINHKRKGIGSNLRERSSHKPNCELPPQQFCGGLCGTQLTGDITGTNALPRH